MAVTSFTSTSTHNNKQPASSVGLQHNIITSTTKDTTKIEKQQEKELNVIICGGGPGGLLASVLLNNIGIKSTTERQER
jgi:ribulose 1,5-bisphosphate synthetase/thiazole synthase